MEKNEKLLPVPLEYTRQFYMICYFRSKSGKLEKNYFVPETGRWVSRPTHIKSIISIRGISYTSWKTRWFLNMTSSQIGSQEWARKWVEIFYPEKLPDTKRYIIEKLLEDPEYECDFWITKKDLISEYYRTRKENGITPRNYDWSRVPETIKYGDLLHLYVLDINPQTGKPRGDFSTRYNYLIECVRDAALVPQTKDKDKIISNFIKRAKEIHGDKYDYSEISYVSSTTPVKIFCRGCGEYFYQAPSNHLQGHGCATCGNQKESLIDKDTLEKYIREGKSYEEIGTLFGCTGHQVGVISVRLGLHQIKLDLEEKALQEKRDLYIGYLEDGLLKSEIARTLGVTQQAVSYNMNQLGINYEDYVRPGYKTVLDNLEEVKSRLEEGKSVPEVATELGISVNILRFIINKKEKIDLQSIKKSIEEDVVSQIEDLAESGLNLSTIQIKLGMSYSRLKRLVNEYNIEIHPRMSSGEYFVSEFLRDNQIDYEFQDKYDDILEESRVFVDFSFIIGEQKYFIEYNGEQHYRLAGIFHQYSQEKFERQKYRDSELRRYSKDKGIILIEVPYLYNTQESISEFLNKTILQGISPETLVDYNSLYKTK